MPHPVEMIRNIAFCGHGSAGKTTLVDKLLVFTGAVKRPASVDDGTSICDFDEEEKHHKHSVEAAITHFEHSGLYFQAIDTPGYPDFIAQTIGALAAVDNVAIVVNGHSGVEVNTRRAFREAESRGLGRIIVLNKMDDDGADFSALVEQIKEAFGPACLPFNVPLGAGQKFRGVSPVLKPADDISDAVVDPASLRDALVESIIENDEEVTERYFEGTPPTDEEINRLVTAAVAAGTLVPIVCCSARSGAGIEELLNAFDTCALSPAAITRKAKNEAGEEVVLEPKPDGPLAAFVFKTRVDPFVQKLSYIRIFSGTLKKDDTVHVAGVRKAVKLHQLFRVQAGETQPVDEAGPGEIIAVAKTEDLHTGSSLGEFIFPPLKFPTPMVGLAVTPKSRGDEGKLSGALHKLAEEDPTLHLDRDPQTKELVMNGMSDLHLQILRERLKRRDKVEVDTKPPAIPYRETIQAEAEGSYRHKKQSGGRGQFGEVHIRVFPFPPGTNVEDFANKSRFPSMRACHHDPSHNFLWVDSIVGGSIPNNFLPAVEKGFKERLERGVLAGYKVQDVCVEVFFGKHHPVDSSEAAFKIAGSMALRDVLLQAKPVILEPVVTLHITVPSDKVGDINSDMSSRRGRVLGMTSAGGDWQTVTAEAPLAEIANYARSLSSITAGQGSYTVDFSHYAPVPGNVQKEIVEKAVLHEEEDV